VAALGEVIRDLMAFAKNTRRTSLICLLLGAATLLTFWPQTGRDFITYDDSFYLTENAQVQQGLTWEGVAWALRTGTAGNWHPLTWLSHMLDVQLFGLNAGWHHLTSLLLHTANAVLLFLLLQRMTGAAWRSAFVAALFALHPLHVQSVAWAAERKDVLSAFFFMLTLGAYSRYAQRPKSEDRNPRTEGNLKAEIRKNGSTHPSSRFPLPPSAFYLLSLLFFALGLMSKPMLVTVPFLLLLLDYWPLCRLGPRTQDSEFNTLLARLWEKLPFFALSAASCVVTVWAQSGGGAVVPVAVLSFPQRLANALAAYLGYLEQMLWPANLAVLYPLEGGVPAGTLILSAALLLVVTAGALWSWRRRPYLAVGWFWYLGMLVPVIGLVQVGMQRMADRYTYLPLIGVFVMVTWEAAQRWDQWRWGRQALAATAGLVLAACALVTHREVGYWKDSEQLFGRAIEVAPANYIALDNYGRALLKQGKLPEAVQAFTAAVELRPELDASRCGLGTALLEQAKYAEAADQFTRVLDLQPDHFVALIQLGMIRGRQGKLEAAADLLSRGCRLRPDDAGAHNNLGNVLILQGKYEEAARQFEETVRLKPSHSGALNNLALTRKKLGRPEAAIAHYREALVVQPDSTESLNNLAWTLAAHPDARFRNGAEAVALATRACEATRYQNPIPLATLAAAYAETGQFREAVSFAVQAQEAAKVSQPALGTRLAAMLEAFRAGHAYHAD
jgi:tetratricopeptide (TPR) repeat protein